jgi:hypothetical protein
MVPRPRIELETDPYHGSVIPFNYRGILPTILYKTKFDKQLT